MQKFANARQLQRVLERQEGKIAFVPTMGALHAGHTALLDAARPGHDVVVASIFVNPTQFNEASDLAAYPRTPEEDAVLLERHGCDFLYQPTVEDVYPAGMTTQATEKLDFGTLTERMEGAHRPGHFAGVAQVVHRLLDIVRPDTLVMGQKDYQQVAIVRSMIDQMKLPVQLRIVPTVREASGLALSSRNRRLDAREQEAAATIHRHLAAVAAGIRAGWPARELEATACKRLAQHELLQPEYVEVCDGDTLLPYVDKADAREIVVAAAVHCGPVRLIDNVIV